MFLYLHLCYQPGGDTGIVRCERVVRVCTTRGTLNIESRYLSVHKTTGRRWIPRPPSAIQTLRRSHSMPKPGSPEKPPKPGKRPRKGRTDEGRSGGQTLKKMNFEGKKSPHAPCERPRNSNSLSRHTHVRMFESVEVSCVSLLKICGVRCAELHMENLKRARREEES